MTRKLDVTLLTDDPERTWRDYRAVIENAINNQPRTLQKRIGPSELGTDCDRCLISKLAGIEEIREGIAWLPWVGNAVHDQLEQAFLADNEINGHVRYLVEHRVTVGTVGKIEVSGKADLFDLYQGEVTDWKIVGKNTLTKAKQKGPTPVYRKQGHLYGLGFLNGGAHVRRVRIAFLPRNEPSLDNAFIWSEPFDAQVALEAIARANFFAEEIETFGVDFVLREARPHIGDYSCARYPGGVQSKPNFKSQFSDLLE